MIRIAFHTLSRCLLLTIVVATVASIALSDENRRDYGLAGNANWTVIAPRGDYLAEAVLAQAERYRREIALEWLGSELPRGAEFTHISVLINDQNKGLTLFCGPGRSLPGDHRMWIDGTRQLVTGELLAHEVAHVVLNSVRPPIWIHEGIASRYDEPGTKGVRARIVMRWTSSGRFPAIAPVLRAKAIAVTDWQSYVVAESLVEFLLSRGDRATLLEFAQDGQRDGWAAALQTHYRIGGVAQLAGLWQQWVQRGVLAKGNGGQRPRNWKAQTRAPPRGEERR